MFVVPPKFVRRPENKVVTEGDPAVMRCAAIGTPPPTIKWIYNNTVLDGRTKIL